MSEQRFRDANRDEVTFQYDPYAHALTVIEEEHRLTHDGMVFHTSGRASVTNTNSLDILFAVPAGVRPHFRKADLELGDGPCDAYLYEGTTTSDDGTALNTYNRNRNSSNVSGTVLTSGPTISDVGTLIHDRYFGDTGGVWTRVSVHGDATGEEWVLAPSTKYLLRITNNSGVTIVVNYQLMHYEISYTQ